MAANWGKGGVSAPFQRTEADRGHSVYAGLH